MWLTWLLDNAASLNLLVSAAILAAGLIIYLRRRPAIFEEHSYTKRAFEFWILQWFTFVFIFIVYLDRDPGSLRWLLALVDLQSIFALGFYWAFIDGRDYRWQAAVTNLAVLYGLLLAWNLLLTGSALSSQPGDLWRLLWVLPSGILSAAALSLMAVVMWLRYRASAIPFAVVALVYIVLQRPVYAGTFVQSDTTFPLVNFKTDPGWVLALALGKLFYALLLYTLFFLRATNYEPIRLPPASMRIAAVDLSRAVRWFAVALGGAVVSGMGEVIVQALWKVID